MNRNLLFVACALLFWGFGEGLFFNFVPIYLDNQFLLSKYEIGLVLGAFGLSDGDHSYSRRAVSQTGSVGRPLLIIAWMLGLLRRW